MSVNESMLEEIPEGEYCYINIPDNNHNCTCEYDCSCDKILVKKKCPYKEYLDNGLTKCTLLNITSEEDEDFENERKVCGFNELEEKINF
jgi:hypothetical protein